MTEQSPDMPLLEGALEAQPAPDLVGFDIRTEAGALVAHYEYPEDACFAMRQRGYGHQVIRCRDGAQIARMICFRKAGYLGRTGGR